MVSSVDIKLDSVYCYLFGSDQELDRLLYKRLYRVTQRGLNTNDVADGHSFYGRSESNGCGYFYRGFLNDVLELLQKYKITYTITDTSTPTDSTDVHKDVSADIIPGYTLRDYQLFAVQQIVRHRYGYLQLATGAGKTLIAGAFIKFWQDRIYNGTGSVLFLVNTRYLVEQTLSNLKKYGIKNVMEFHSSMLSKGENYSGNVYVSTVQKLSSKKANSNGLSRFLQSVDVLILDECHHQSANTWKAIVRKSKNVKYRVGLTATPYKTRGGESYEDGFVTGLLGCPFAYIPYHYLRDKGYLSDIRVRTVKVHRRSYITTFDNIPSSLSSWLDSYRNGMVYNGYVYECVYKILQEHKNQKILILTYLVDHAKIVNEWLNNLKELNTSVFLVTSKDNDLPNLSYLNRLDDFIVVTTTVFDEGIDLPELDVVILLSGIKSIIKTIQRVGRGSRLTENKNVSFVYDFDLSFDSMLHSHFEERMSTYKEERFNIEEYSVSLSENCDVVKVLDS